MRFCFTIGFLMIALSGWAQGVVKTESIHFKYLNQDDGLVTISRDAGGNLVLGDVFVDSLTLAEIQAGLQLGGPGTFTVNESTNDDLVNMSFAEIESSSALRLQNEDATDGNHTLIGFDSANGNNMGVVGFRSVDHPTDIGDFVIGLRAPTSMVPVEVIHYESGSHVQYALTYDVDTGASWLLDSTGLMTLLTAGTGGAALKLLGVATDALFTLHEPDTLNINVAGSGARFTVSDDTVVSGTTTTPMTVDTTVAGESDLAMKHQGELLGVLAADGDEDELQLIAAAAKELTLGSAATEWWKIIAGGDLIPQTSSLDVGSSSSRVDTLYGVDLNIEDSTAGNLTLGTFNLGAAATNGSFEFQDAGTSQGVLTWGDLASYGGNSTMDFALIAGSGKQLGLGATSVLLWEMNNGTLLPLTDNTEEIGGTSRRVEKFWAYDGDFADDLNVGDDLSVADAITASHIQVNRTTFSPFITLAATSYVTQTWTLDIQGSGALTISDVTNGDLILSLDDDKSRLTHVITNPTGSSVAFENDNEFHYTAANSLDANNILSSMNVITNSNLTDVLNNIYVNTQLDVTAGDVIDEINQIKIDGTITGGGNAIEWNMITVDPLLESGGSNIALARGLYLKDQGTVPTAFEPIRILDDSPSYFDGKLNVGVDTSDTNAPLNIGERIVVPSTNVAAGDFYFNDEGQLYMRDGSRSKWLSAEVSAFEWGSDGGSDGAYIQHGGDLAGANTGIKIPFDATIVYVTATSSGGDGTKTIEIRTNGSLADSFALTGGEFADNLRNVDLNSGDDLQIFAAVAGAAVNDLSVVVWVKWRL
jgi:hypothetical protein